MTHCRKPRARGRRTECHRVGREAAVEEDPLLVLHDDQAALPGVLKQPAVGLDQRRVGLVRARADDDRIEAAEVAALERGAIEQHERNPQALESLGHPVGRAANVAHTGERRQHQRRHPEDGGRGADVRPRPDVGVVHRHQSQIVAAATCDARHRPERHRTGGGDGRRTHREGHGLALVLAGQPEGLGRHGGPTGRDLERERARGGVPGAVGERDGESPRGAACRRHQLRPGIDVHVHPGHHRHRPAQLAPRLVIELEAHLAGGRRRAVEDEGGHEGRRPERLAPDRGRGAGPVVEGRLGCRQVEVGRRGRRIRPDRRRVGATDERTRREAEPHRVRAVQADGRSGPERGPHLVRAGAGVPAFERDADPLAGHHPVVVAARVADDPGRDGDGPIEVGELLRRHPGGGPPASEREERRRIRVRGPRDRSGRTRQRIDP